MNNTLKTKYKRYDEAFKRGPTLPHCRLRQILNSASLSFVLINVY